MDAPNAQAELQRIEQQIEQLQSAAGGNQDALKQLEAATKEEPGNADAWKNLGVAQIQLSAFDEAIGSFEKARNLKDIRGRLRRL